MNKVCSKCGVSKDLSEFYDHKTSRGGKRARCKPCFRLYEENEVNVNEVQDYSMEMLEIKYKHDKWYQENKERLKKERDLKKT